VPKVFDESLIASEGITKNSRFLIRKKNHKLDVQYYFFTSAFKTKTAFVHLFISGIANNLGLIVAFFYSQLKFFSPENFNRTVC